MEHVLAGKVYGDVNFKGYTDKNGNERELASFTLKCWSGKDDEKSIFYNITAFGNSEVEKLKKMQLKENDSLQMIGELHANTYTDKQGREITRASYMMTYVDPEKGQDATLLKEAGAAIRKVKEERIQLEGGKSAPEKEKATEPAKGKKTK